MICPVRCPGEAPPPGGQHFWSAPGWMRAGWCLLLVLGAARPGPAGSDEPVPRHSIPRERGWRTIQVTRLDDDPENPKPGSFRWAVLQKGPRVVRFALPGTIHLKDRIVVRESALTIDGGDAPGLGVCLAGGALEFRGCHDVTIRHLRVRLGDANTRRRNRRQHRRRPENSRGLDCISLHECRNVLIEHVSASWSCDEILSIVRCQNVIVQWCILSEPLSDWRLHPYGDRHACCLNASASTLSVRRCLFAHYVIRGPQFEANDMRRPDRWDVRMEAVDNVMFDFKKSGSRYTTGIEDHRREAAGKRFLFQFIGNLYLSTDTGRTSIEAITRHGTTGAVQMFAADNFELAADGTIGPATIRTDDHQPVAAAPPSISRQLQAAPLFQWATRTRHGCDSRLLEEVLQNAGCSRRRDAVDERLVAEVRGFRARRMIDSPADRGGYPALDGTAAAEDRRRIVRMLFDRRF